MKTIGPPRPSNTKTKKTNSTTERSVEAPHSGENRGLPVDVAAYMAERIPLVDHAIEARLGELSSGDGAIPATLSGAMRHLLFPGGKRLRPVMALAAAEAVGGPAEAALPLGVAVEMVHTYSLIHDDLPCMDDDDLRRGRPTVHNAYDEATAVLAGDALLTEAFAVLAEGAAPAEAALRIQTVALLSHSAGAQGLVGGQVDDLAFEAAGGEAEGTRAAFLASIHARKTAALFRASIEGGATLAGANIHQREALEVSLARRYGLPHPALQQDEEEDERPTATRQRRAE